MVVSHGEKLIPRPEPAKMDVEPEVQKKADEDDSDLMIVGGENSPDVEVIEVPKRSREA
jgi:hypothetical protein